MILEITLENRMKPGIVQKTDIWNVDPSDIAKIAQAQGHKGVRGLVSEIIGHRLPSHLRHREVVDWSFKDVT